MVSYYLSWRVEQGVKIMLAGDPKGKHGPVTPLPDPVTIHPQKKKKNIINLLLLLCCPQLT